MALMKTEQGSRQVEKRTRKEINKKKKETTKAKEIF